VENSKNQVKNPENPVKIGKTFSSFKVRIPKPETPEQARKLKRLTYTLVAIISGIIVLSSIFIITKKGNSQNQISNNEPTGTRNSEPSPEVTQKPREWKTYTNLQYGFEFRFPPELSTVPKEETPPGFIPVCPNGNVICLAYSENPYPKSEFEAAGFTVQTIPGIPDEVSCATYSADNQDVTTIDKTKLINGTKFYYGKNSSAATGHQIESLVYRTFHDQTCFELQENLSTSSCEEGSLNSCPNKFTNDDKSKIFATFENIITTFKFTGGQQNITRAPSSREKDGCIISGCSSEICSDKVQFSTCELKPGAECYKNATCERQVKGRCGWTQTDELTSCLSGSQ